MGPDKAQTRAPCWPRLGCVWPPWPTSDGDPSRISSSRKPKIGRSVQRNIPPPLRGGEPRREKSSPGGRNLPGKFPPGGGNHRHRHQVGFHQDHHHHHLHAQDHHHHHLHAILL